VPPTVTRLGVERRGRVAVELDGAPWRTLPVDVVARAGLTEGRVLDRAALRLLRQELRRAEALAVAARALRRQDLTERGIAERLARASVAPAAAEESLAVLSRAGLVDDARFARTRAASLADRGYGDAAIRDDLERRGVGPEPIRKALETLEHESERARRLVERRGPGAATARRLAAKGFGDEALEAAAGADFAHDP
jgi:SOS response regulatory protein OraA/RecX